MTNFVPAAAAEAPALPAITTNTDDALRQITTALGVPRDVLPSKGQIDHTWSNLPRLLEMIPTELRDERLIRLCVAISSGLFDSALNYIWNITIVELRRKVVQFGLPIVGQLTSQSLDERKLSEMMDHELLKLCYELSLVSEDGYFKLDQCRSIRNNFSAAHPAVGKLDEDEVVNFISRCTRSALSTADVPAGVNFTELVSSIKAAAFNEDQKEYWIGAILNTHVAQRELIATAVHGIFCDEASGQGARTNCINLFRPIIKHDSVPSKVVDQHQSYIGKGVEVKAAASRDFFTQLGLLDLLPEAERHSIISKACDRLSSVHNGTDNFYNEPPFAARLLEIVENAAVPSSVTQKFVETVISCAIGNQYGDAWGARADYRAIIKHFTPRELEVMFALQNSSILVGRKINSYTNCAKRFAGLVRMFSQTNIPTTLQTVYNSWISYSNQHGYL
ncbi:hypothetical protein [Pseudovibrio sp. WM33]|uniref:hypothetical protein n=1 Tax=Pseudovibrio sp. WM33 TaxID=1735585 RepID=UPI0007AEDE5D|nr:hypothetical protein [Pseudovibrio sp. WM33]KZL23690.1 hypothetical protein PsWM33_02978 [Pseudovibrio sp. WM33]